MPRSLSLLWLPLHTQEDHQEPHGNKMPKAAKATRATLATMLTVTTKATMTTMITKTP